MKKPILLILAFLSFLSFAETKPLSVVVVGGGPTGLGAAIEARLAGADVVVIEKRDAYTRLNTLFLYTVTVELFEKWNATIPKLTELDFRGQRRGFVLIKDLEEGLAKRAHELGIRKIHGEFKDFGAEEKVAIIQGPEGELSLSYDILVGADGSHSAVREKLGISCERSGEGIAGVSMVPATNPEKMIGVEIGQHKDIFAKKVTVPFGTILFLQNRPGASISEITQKELETFNDDMGWHEEARLIADGAIFNLENIPVYLQHAAVFSDPKRSAILIGDAAASGTFYQGMGANYGFKTTEIAGEFVRLGDFDAFEREMAKVVDVLMKDSAPLFVQLQ